ncbi:MAG: sugar transferase [Elusimicrobia bacterium]|nr:sugar transferase [Elusimicrobiota bacterium]
MSQTVAPPKTKRPAASAVWLPPWLRHALRTVLHLLCDALAIWTAYRLAYLLRFDLAWWVRRFPVPGDIPPWSLYERILPAVVPLWLLIFWYSSKLYNSSWMTWADRFLQIVKGCVLGTGATLVATYIYGRLAYSRMMLVLALPTAAVLVTLGQTVVLWLDEWMSRHEAARPVIIVGRGTVAEMIVGRIRSRHPEAAITELAELPAPEDLERALKGGPFYELILLRSSLPHPRILEAAELCEAHGVRFTMVPDLLELRLGEVQMDHSLGLPAYRIEHTQLTTLNFLAKRVFDLAFSLSLLLATAVPLAAVCLLIKLDSEGPILYKQKRYGFRGKIFFAYKFRTMVADAESRIESVKELNAHKGAFFKAKADPRVTRVGKWLRRFSLDEFPQFLNVLRGEMSVVGPRPLALTTGELESLQRDFGATAKKRMNILPGITGLWQVSGRSDVSSEQRFGLDLFYIEHWSLGLDLEIILKTAPAMFLGKGAY